MARETVLGQRLDAVDWIPVEEYFGGAELDVSSGACVSVLSEDNDTGAVTMLLRLPPGWSTAGPESHSVFQEELLLEGDFALGGVQYEAPCYFCFPPGAVHGPGTSSSGCVLLITLDGPFDIEYHE